MSTFNLKIEVPDVDYDWYQAYIDKTPRCPANWKMINEESQFDRYKDYIDGVWKLQLNQNEIVQIPFNTNNVFFDNVTNKTFTFRHYVYKTGSNFSYSIRIWFNETDYKDLLYPSGDFVEYTDTIDIPIGTEFIRIEPDINSSLHILLFTDIKFNISSNDYYINTEQNDVTIGQNKKLGVSISGKISSVTVGKRDINYKNQIILTHEEELELRNLVRLAKQLKLLTSCNININDEARNNLSNIPYGGEENIVKYWYNTHSVSQISGLYSYITISYKRKIKSKDIYI